MPRAKKMISSVTYSGEFRRIEKIPRRLWDREPYKSEIVDLMTDELKAPDGTMRLWPAQAAALADIVLARGGFFPIGVGQGKALISLLAAQVLEAERPLLFVPAALREQTVHRVIPEMRKHWRFFHVPTFSYTELSLEKNSALLEEYEPDLIIFDEVHHVKARTAGRTKRLLRYFKAHPETMCVAMSGTVSNRSILDFAHILAWCLKEHAPIPLYWHELQTWSGALDEKVPEDQKVEPGALLRFCASGENARQGFRRRLVETPGIVATKESDLGVSLQIVKHPIEMPDDVARMIDRMRQTWTTPNGDIITEAVDLWRHVRELSLGFWYRWDPAPPRAWLEARKQWKIYVRDTLSHNRRGLDTELQVWNESAEKKNIEWIAWNAIKDSFRINTVPEWISPFALLACQDWLIKERGICWVEHRAFGEKLFDGSCYPYFGAGDSRILSHEGPCIAPIAAHGEGKNLQRFAKNLITAPPTSGKTWEQLIGRTHRAGQEADEVTFEVFLHAPELEASFAQARADAVYLEDSLGNRQKLNYADIVI